jgi:hypothetical protein
MSKVEVAARTMGRMYAVKNSARALIAAAIPLAAVHAVSFAMSLLRTQTFPVLLALPSADKVLVLYLVQLTFDTALLFAGHLMLRGRAISGRFAYALMGGAMAAASYAIVLRNGLLLVAPDSGTAITAGLLPTLAGMIAGFLYCQFAGFAPSEAWPKFSTEALITSCRFDGPVRVRTSIAATIIAAVTPAVMTALLTLAMFSPLSPYPEAAIGPPMFVSALPAQMFLVSLTATIVPVAIFVVCTHHIARALHRQRGLDYAALGGLLAALCSFLFVPFTPFPFTSDLFPLVASILCGAIMGGLYRRFAGLEPVPLPEPVIVADENTLVPADHSSRQGHGVIFID